MQWAPKDTGHERNPYVVSLHPIGRKEILTKVPNIVCLKDQMKKIGHSWETGTYEFKTTLGCLCDKKNNLIIGTKINLDDDTEIQIVNN